MAEVLQKQRKIAYTKIRLFPKIVKRTVWHLPEKELEIAIRVSIGFNKSHCAG